MRLINLEFMSFCDLEDSSRFRCVLLNFVDTWIVEKTAWIEFYFIDGVNI